LPDLSVAGLADWNDVAPTSKIVTYEQVGSSASATIADDVIVTGDQLEQAVRVDLVPVPDMLGDR
jgi:hypothetical protein